MHSRSKVRKPKGGMVVKTSTYGGSVLDKCKYSSRELLEEQHKAQTEHRLDEKWADARSSNTNDMDDGIHDGMDISPDGAASDDEGYETDDSSDEEEMRKFMGDEGVEISHGGGEFDRFFARLKTKKKRKIDWRTRRDRIQNRVDAFHTQMKHLVDSYISWSYDIADQGLDDLGRTPPGSEGIGEYLRLTIVDTFNTSKVDIPILTTKKTIASALVRQGVMPCSPYTPTVAVTIRLLELFRLAQLRSPSLSVQSWIKTLSDIHGIPWRGYASEQFSICFDVYLEIRRIVRRVVLGRLGRGAANWRLQNACPCCMYQLEQETPQKIGFLFTMDGNDSLKRVERRLKVDCASEEDQPLLGTSKERLDNRDCRGDYILTRERVDVWGKETFDTVAEAIVKEGEGEEYLCSDRWTNARNEFSAKMWGIFEETGIFLSLCRHGFILVAADMVRSGELSKYALAVLNEILMNIDPRLGAVGAGYDIGCHFKKTVKKSDLASLAEERMFMSLVGLFHGHAHNRLCQTEHLGTYVEGLGLENLEGCERFFNLSNRLASSMRYSSRFHRWQRITEYFHHMDRVETYSSLSLTLVNNYTHALEVLDSHGDFVRNLRLHQIEDPAIIETWLQEEREYLKSLRKEPDTDTWEMDYLEKLSELLNLEVQLTQARHSFVVENPAEPPSKRKKGAPRRVNPETTLRHAGERYDVVMRLVQDYESKLNIRTRWTPTSEDWRRVELKVTNRAYQRALDHLEGLVVSRIFELAKMNMGGTGYKLRKHIAKALQSRSQSIRNAVEKYNTAAASLKPPRTPLKAKCVVEYAFLGQFDLLRDSRNSLEGKPWATPLGRLLLDQFYKLRRAEETRVRLNMEITRLVTQMRDEEEMLLKCEVDERAQDPAMAHQIRLYREERSRFNPMHEQRLHKLSQKPGFTGSLVPGQRLPSREEICNEVPLSGDDAHPRSSPGELRTSALPSSCATPRQGLPSSTELSAPSLPIHNMPPPVSEPVGDDWGGEDPEESDEEQDLEDLEETFQAIAIASDVPSIAP